MSSNSASTDPNRSLRIGKYEILAPLASTEEGTCYQATDGTSGLAVSLCVLPPSITSVAASLETLRKGARQASRLRHANILGVYEIGDFHGTHFIAAELFAGVSLQDYGKARGKLASDEARRLLVQAARSLNYLHGHGIVGRDLGLSNFLVGGPKDSPVLKLKALELTRPGEAKPAASVDCLAPELARDTKNADARSDIYALGCILYFLLGGRLPFPQGSRAEKLAKHAKEQPEDIRKLNARVSDDLIVVLRRMLAKKPTDRYRSMEELLKEIDLQGEPAPADDDLVPAGVANLSAFDEEGITPADDGETAPPEPPASSEKNGMAAARAPAGKAAGEKSPAENKSNIRWWIGGVAGVALAAIVVGVLLNMDSKPAGKGLANQQSSGSGTAGAIPDSQEVPDKKEVKNETGGSLRTDTSTIGEPKTSDIRWLYPAVARIQAKEGKDLWEWLESPWRGDPQPGRDKNVFNVSRIYRGSAAPQFDSITAACAAAPANQWTVIEVYDNGPLYEAPPPVADRNIIIKAARGYRPLVVWDLAARPPGSKNAAFLALSQGRLALVNLDLVVRWTDSGSGEPPAFVQLGDADFHAWGCTFSLAGKNSSGFDVVRQEGARRGGKCRLTRCYAHGAGLVGLDVRAPGVEALIENSLLVGTDQPLIRAAGYSAARTTVRIVRSTLVSAQQLIQLRPATANESKPALSILCWDALLAHSGSDPGGELFDARNVADDNQLVWQSANTLFAGWKTLFLGKKSVPWSDFDLAAWHRHWNQTEGARAAFLSWPPSASQDLADSPADLYQIKNTDTELYYLASSQPPGAIGCATFLLPPGRPGWLALTYDRPPPKPIDLLFDESTPGIPAGDPNLYHGEVIDVGKVDLGSYLQEVQRTKRLAPLVVIRLVSSQGLALTRPSAPIRMKGTHLVLHADLTRDKDGLIQRLMLVADGKSSAEQSGFIQIESGILDMVGIDLRYPDFALALVPPYLVSAVGGSHLRMHQCRIQGPILKLPANYVGLILLEGSRIVGADQACGCALNHSIFIGGGVGVHVYATGARVRLRDCLTVTAGDGFRVQPHPKCPARLNLHFLLEQNTLAARQALFHVFDVDHLDVVAEPVLVQARGNVFVSPFADADRRAGLAAFEQSSLIRGMFHWQGEHNLYDKRIHYFVAPADALPKDRQDYAGFSRLFGFNSDRLAKVDVPLTQTLDLARLNIDRLDLPSHARGKDTNLGADFTALGLVKRVALPR